jgi:hypothetical protein
VQSFGGEKVVRGLRGSEVWYVVVYALEEEVWVARVVDDILACGERFEGSREEIRNSLYITVRSDGTWVGY